MAPRVMPDPDAIPIDRAAVLREMFVPTVS